MERQKKRGEHHIIIIIPLASSSVTILTLFIGLKEGSLHDAMVAVCDIVAGARESKARP